MTDESKAAIFWVVTFIILVSVVASCYELKRNTSEVKMYLVDKNWDIKTSEYWTEHYTELVRKENCTGTGSDRKCTDYFVTESRSRDHWIKDCRTSGGIKDVVVYPVCEKSRNDSWFSTTTYFILLFGRDKERMTLQVDLATFNKIEKEDVCPVDVYEGLFGKWLRGVKGECR